MERKIFDKQFVYFMWDDSLKGKKCFAADEVDLLEQRVENNAIDSFYTVKSHSTSFHYPFCIDLSKQNAEYDNTADYRFVYYDPNYEVKWAWKQGACIQCRVPSGVWLNTAKPDWDNESLEFRIKPVNYRPFKSIQELKSTFLKMPPSSITPANAEPMIWVRSKSNTSSTYMITHFCENMGVVYLCGQLDIGLEQLFDDYTFLDGGVIGVTYEK